MFGNVLKIIFRNSGCGGLCKPMPVNMAVSTDLIDFYIIFTIQNSIFNLPSANWSLWTQLESKGSGEFLKCTFLLFFETFNADDKLLIGNGHQDTEWNGNKDLMLSDGHVTFLDKRQRLSVPF